MAMDTDHNGKVEFQEFYRMARKTVMAYIVVAYIVMACIVIVEIQEFYRMAGKTVMT